MPTGLPVEVRKTDFVWACGRIFARYGKYTCTIELGESLCEEFQLSCTQDNLEASYSTLVIGCASWMLVLIFM